MRLILLVVMSLAFSPTTWASDGTVDCKNGGNNQMEMNICSARAAHRIEAFLEELDAFLGKNDDDEGRSLRANARRSFFVYSNDQCDSYADGYRGGSIQPLIRNSCFRSVVLARASWLIDRMCDQQSDECETRRKPWLERLKALEESN